MAQRCGRGQLWQLSGHGFLTSTDLGGPWLLAKWPGMPRLERTQTNMLQSEAHLFVCFLYNYRFFKNRILRNHLLQLSLKNSLF